MAKLGETTLRVLMKGQMGTRICSTFGQKKKWEHPYTIRKSAELNNFKKAIYGRTFSRYAYYVTNGVTPLK